MLTRNSLKMSSKFPKFHTNSLDFAQSSVKFSPNFYHLKIQYKPVGMLENDRGIVQPTL